MREAEMRPLVEAACRAPSSQNSQPWRFVVRGPVVDVLADRSRQLQVADPDGRELVVSCGAAAGTLMAAARGAGFAPAIELLPDGETSDLMARVTLADGHRPDGEQTAMAAAIESRQTVRRPFRGGPPPADLVARLCEIAAARGVWLAPVADGAREPVAELVAEADRLQWSDQDYRRELADWLRSPGSAEGIPTPAAGVSRLTARMFDMGPRMAAADRRLAQRAPMLAVLGVDAGTPRSWFAGGVGLAEVLLRATASGVSAGFLNQPIQVSELRPAVATAAGRPAAHPLLILRLGDTPRSRSRRSGRRPLEEVADGLA